MYRRSQPVVIPAEAGIQGVDTCLRRAYPRLERRDDEGKFVFGIVLYVIPFLFVTEIFTSRVRCGRLRQYTIFQP